MKEMINIVINILLVVGFIVEGSVFYWIGKDAAKSSDKSKSSNEENSGNDEQKFAEIFKSEDNDVIKRR